MADEPKEIVRTLLDSIQDPRVVAALCGPDVTYVSLNYSNPDLNKIMPWCGTGKGINAISKTFHDVARYWKIDSFTPEVISEKKGTWRCLAALLTRQSNCGKRSRHLFRSFAR